ncbi:putative plasma membrane phosphate transporter Pho87 [Aspergillus undulatus]|uniref:putative plasma membrane phosphate transporter Pho87 n=1 Tax=Aspergillus undulatus TaxID=1810928 RepID=UPI003CCDC8AD
MPPRLNLFAAKSAIPVFRQPSAAAVRRTAAPCTPLQRRWNSSNSDGKEKKDLEEAQRQAESMPHVSEEAAEINKIMGKEKRCDGTPSSPELEQGTPVSELLSRDKEGQKYAPKVFQDQMKNNKRSFSTSARRYQLENQNQNKPGPDSIPDPAGLGAGANGEAGAMSDAEQAALLENMISQVSRETEDLLPDGLKYPAPESLPPTENFRHRYSDVVEQFTKNLMKDGKLAIAQKNMSYILDFLRSSPAPNTNPRRPLLPGPPAPQLPLDPVLYLTLIVDSVAPLIKLHSATGIAGGGQSIQIPVALTERQRRRAAIGWIIDSSERRRDSKFAARVANELLAVAEGRSGVWEKRENVHKLAPRTSQRFKPTTPHNVSSNAGRPGVARFAYATSASTNNNGITLPPQDIELVEYPVPPRTTTTRPPRNLPQELRTQPSRLLQSFQQTERDPSGCPTQQLQIDRFRWGKPVRFRHWVEALHHRSAKSQDSDATFKMKFSHSIQFNAVPDWSAYYIAYSNLKKLIYTLEQQVHRQNEQGVDVEYAPLLDDTQNADGTFQQALDVELDKICSFYRTKEAEILEEVGDVMRDAEEYTAKADGADMNPMHDSMTKGRRVSTGSIPEHQADLGSERERRESLVSEPAADDDEDSDDERPLTARRSLGQSQSIQFGPSDDDRTEDMRSSIWADSRYGLQSQTLTRRGTQHEQFTDPTLMDLFNSAASLKKRIIAVYVSLCGLKSYIQLNKTGFSKALKKYDKIIDRDLRRQYIGSTVSRAYPFLNETMEKVEGRIGQIEQLYADLTTTGDLDLAKRELRLHLREHVVWERNTVWREMIGIERKAQAANVGLRRTLLGGDADPTTARRQGDEQAVSTKEVRTPLGVFSAPTWLCSANFATLVVVIVVFATLLSVRIMEKPEQQNCLAMLVFVSLLWATEVIPLFVTSLLIPFLVVLLGIMKSDEKPYKRLGPKEATTVAFGAMWTPVIMLLLGGFTIAAALSKYDIARRMAMFVLSKAGSNHRVVLLTNMFVSMFLSMWISNVASPVLCYSIIQPLLRNLQPDSSFARALVLGIALSANVGGAASPIASPQNIIALQNMYPSISWGTWFFISLPVCIISILLIWVLLLVTFRPGKDTTIVPIRPVKDKFSGIQYFVSIVTLTTIGLWCGSHQLEHVFGDMGVIAIIPIVLFFGTGILNKEDFNNFLWTIIILAAGGLCLGKAVTSSGLLHTIAEGIRARVEGFSLYGVLIAFSALILVIATFISHTVAALIILPLVRQIGVGMDDPHPNLLVMASALMCSVAMALPTSGFPNMTAIMTEVPQTGQRYLQVRHFLTRGIPASLMSFAVIVTLGYGLMRVAGL